MDQTYNHARDQEEWGDDDTAEIKVAKRRLQWPGHLARMADHRLPKVALFSWLSEPKQVEL